MQIGSDRHEAVLRLVVRSSPGALFLRAFGSHWCWVIELLYQPEAHGFSTNFASRKRIAFTNQHFVRRTMGVMNDLIDAGSALSAGSLATSAFTVAGVVLATRGSAGWHRLASARTFPPAAAPTPQPGTK